MRMIFLLAFLLFTIAPAYAAAAYKEVSDDCRDDNGNDRCAPAAQNKMRKAYGLDDVETLMKAGVTMRRAMYVDGYGRDAIAISFVRRPGASPYVEIRSPCVGEKECPLPLTANISSQMWDKVLDQSKNFDQKLARETQAKPEGEEESIRICLHSSVVVAEAVDAPEMDQSVSGQMMTKGVIRQDTEDACTQGLTVPFAFELAELALESLPECSGLDPKAFRNTPMLLSACNGLRGDRLAAADANALIDELRDIDWAVQAEFGRFFTLEGRTRAADFSRILGKGKLYLGAPNATDPNNATVKGEIVYFDPDGDDAISAPIELKLAREYGNFKIVNYSIGEQKPVSN